MVSLDDGTKSLLIRESISIGKNFIINAITPSQSEMLKEEAKHVERLKEMESKKYENLARIMAERDTDMEQKREEYRSNILNTSKEELEENLKKAKVYLEKAKKGTSCSSCIALIEDVEGTLDTSMEILIPATKAVEELEKRGEKRKWEDLPEEVREEIKRNIKRAM